MSRRMSKINKTNFVKLNESNSNCQVGALGRLPKYFGCILNYIYVWFRRQTYYDNPQSVIIKIYADKTVIKMHYYRWKVVCHGSVCNAFKYLHTKHNLHKIRYTSSMSK